MAASYEIVDKVKQMPLFQAAFSDFMLRETGQVDSGIIAGDPHLSLYALDFERGEALFVETPPEVDLCLVPFYYIAQYEHAQRALAVPLEEMIQIGQNLPVKQDKLVFIYSTGRAGSTLAGQIFAQLDGVANISEPDALSNMVQYRHFFPQNTAELSRLADAVVRLLCLVKGPGGHVIKGRSFAIECGDIFNDLFPAAKNLFLYRDAVSYMMSSLGAFVLGVKRSEAELEQFLVALRSVLKTQLPLLGQVPDEEWVSTTGLAAHAWLSPMDRYLKLHDRGIEMLAINYDSWLTAPRETAVAMLDYCGMAPADLSAVYAALEKDSQAGTVLSRSTPRDQQALLELADAEELDQILAAHSQKITADFVAPNTLSHS